MPNARTPQALSLPPWHYLHRLSSVPTAAPQDRAGPPAFSPPPSNAGLSMGPEWPAHTGTTGPPSLQTSQGSHEVSGLGPDAMGRFSAIWPLPASLPPLGLHRGSLPSHLQDLCWPSTEPSSLLFVNSSPRLRLRCCLLRKPSLTPTPCSHPAKFSCGICEYFCHGRRYFVCVHLLCLNTVGEGVLTAENHVSHVPCQLWLLVRSRRWEAMAGGWGQWGGRSGGIS